MVLVITTTFCCVVLLLNYRASPESGEASIWHCSDNMEMLSQGRRLAILFLAEIKETAVCNRGLALQRSL